MGVYGIGGGVPSVLVVGMYQIALRPHLKQGLVWIQVGGVEGLYI